MTVQGWQITTRWARGVQHTITFSDEEPVPEVEVRKIYVPRVDPTDIETLDDYDDQDPD